MNDDLILIFTIALLWVGLFLFLIILEKLKVIPNFSEMIAKVYRGYRNDSFSGVFTGFSWAVLDGLLTGIVIAIILRIVD